MSVEKKIRYRLSQRLKHLISERDNYQKQVEYYEQRIDEVLKEYQNIDELIKEELEKEQ